MVVLMPGHLWVCKPTWKMDVSADVVDLFSSTDIAGSGTATTQPNLWSDDFLAGE